MISKEEVCRIAKLARLELTEKEVEKMQKDLSVILDYFDLLKSASAPSRQGYGPLRRSLSEASETREVNALREDKVDEQKREVVQKIIASAPDKKDDYIKVKAIL